MREAESPFSENDKSILKANVLAKNLPHNISMKTKCERLVLKNNNPKEFCVEPWELYETYLYLYGIKIKTYKGFHGMLNANNEFSNMVIEISEKSIPIEDTVFLNEKCPKCEAMDYSVPCDDTKECNNCENLF